MCDIYIHPGQLARTKYWVAVKELELGYHNGYIYIYIVNKRISPK